MSRTSLKGVAMDLNLVVLAGRIAADPEIRSFESGTRLLRLLVTVRSSEPKRRIDVVPVVMWSPDDDVVDGVTLGRSVWIAGSVQRRFWSSGDGRRSRLEVVAHEVSLRDDIDFDGEQGAA
jgi:single-stranded DNA-binding protein